MLAKLGVQPKNRLAAPADGKAIPDIPHGNGEGSDPYNLTPEQKALLASFVNKEYKRRLEERQPFEQKWRMNIAYIEGYQYLVPGAVGTNQLMEAPALFWWEQRRVFNHIAPNIEVRIARLQKAMQIPKVAPSGNELEDIKRANVSNTLLKEIYYDSAIKRKMASIYQWLEATGTVLLKSTWNPNGGESVIDPETGEEICEGNLDISIVPSFEALPDSPLNVEMEDVQSLIHARVYHIDDVKEMWGESVTAEIDEVSRVMSGNGGGGQAASIFGLTDQFMGNTSPAKDHVVVKEYWERPGKKWKQGRLIIVVSDKVVYFGPLPYLNGINGTRSLPFVKCCCVVRPDCFWGKTIAERLIPVQQAYNALRNRKAEYLTHCSMGGWIAEEDSTDMDYLENDGGAPGAIILVRPGATHWPQRIENPPLPPAFETELAALLNEFAILSGVSEISRNSDAPTGVNSGVALDIMLEQDETRISHTVKNVEDLLNEAAGQWLRLSKQYVKGVRQLKAVGKNKVIDLVEWTGSDLDADDITIDSVSALTESPAQKRQMVFTLLQSGLFAPDMDPALRSQILELIELGNWEMADDEDELQRAKADRENRQMVSMKATSIPGPDGQPLTIPPMLPVNSWDNHAIHVQRHDLFRLSVDFEIKSQESPGLAQAMEYHVQAHRQSEAQAQMQAQMQLMQQIPPASGQGPPVMGA